MCPGCQKELTFVCCWTVRSLWGYKEVRTYECPTHGPIFVGPHVSIGRTMAKGRHETPNHGDRDSLIPVPRKPTPTLNSGAIAIPEPDSE